MKQHRLVRRRQRDIRRVRRKAKPRDARITLTATRTVTSQEVEDAKQQYLSQFRHRRCGGNPIAYVQNGRIGCTNCKTTFDGSGFLGEAIERTGAFDTRPTTPSPKSQTLFDFTEESTMTTKKTAKTATKSTRNLAAKKAPAKKTTKAPVKQAGKVIAMPQNGDGYGKHKTVEAASKALYGHDQTLQEAIETLGAVEGVFHKMAAELVEARKVNLPMRERLAQVQKQLQDEVERNRKLSEINRGLSDTVDDNRRELGRLRSELSDWMNANDTLADERDKLRTEVVDVRKQMQSLNRIVGFHVVQKGKTARKAA